MARLQCEQLQGHMADLLEETREGATHAMAAAEAGAGAGEGAGAAVLEGSWSADDLLEDTRPGEPSLKPSPSPSQSLKPSPSGPRPCPSSPLAFTPHSSHIVRASGLSRLTLA